MPKTDHYKAIRKLLEQNQHMHAAGKVFTDFVEMMAISLRNAVDLAGRDEREERYLKIAGEYQKEDLDRFGEAFGHLVMQADKGFDDIVGRLFMDLGLGNDRTGQFFTPYEVCRLTAALSCLDAETKIEKNGFITLGDECVGAGAMVIGVAEHLHSKGINYQHCLCVQATDVDIRAVHMAYVQFALYHIPAVIFHGNCLSRDVWSRWPTPAYLMGGWEWRLRRKDGQGELPEKVAPVAEQLPVISKPETQMALF